MKNTKIAAMLLGLTLGTAGIASAATADSFTDVPKDHWSYEALDYLAQNGVIEGYADGTFAGNRTMSRYEMASIVAKAMQADAKGIGSQAVLEKLEAEYGGELRTLKSQVEENTAAIAANKKAIEHVNIHGFLRTQYDYDKTKGGSIDRGNNRFYMDLRGDFKVNDIWTVKFQNEMNRKYNHGHQRGETGFNSNGQKTWSGHDGNFQRIWVEGYQDGKWINIGRSWRGLGFQNVLFGNESDGFQFGVPIPGTHLTGSGFWMASTGSGNRESIYGVGTWGAIGHSVDINLAYGRSSLDKGEKYGNSEIDYYTMGTIKRNGKTVAAMVPVYKDDNENKRSYGFVASAGVNLTKDVRFITDYIKTDADFQNNSLALRLNYKGTDLNKKGSWGAYARYIRYGANGWLAGDDEWGSTPEGTKGWIVGLKYVPWKNVEWETLYSQQTRKYNTSDEYDRNLFRTQVDFHF